MELSFIISVLVYSITVIPVIYLYILICKYLKMQLKKNRNAIIIKDSESLFINNDSNGLLVNSNLIKSIFVKEHVILVELITNDTYILKHCKNDEDAQFSFNEIQDKLNNIKCK